MGKKRKTMKTRRYKSIVKSILMRNISDYIATTIDTSPDNTEKRNYIYIEREKTNARL